MWKFLVVLCLAALVVADDTAASSSSSSAAFLLVNKALSASEVIVGDTVKVTITITNVGRSPAFNVALDDETWGAPLPVVKTSKIGKIAPGGNASFDYSVTLHDLGAIACDPARVTYTTDDTDKKTARTAYSTRVNEELEGQGVDKRSVVSVLTPSDYERKHSRHIKEWSVFSLLLCVPLGIPLYLYFVRSAELEALEKKTQSRSSK